MLRPSPRRPRLLLSLLLLPMLGSCGLLIREPEPIPTIAHRTVEPGDVLRVRGTAGADAPVAMLEVDAAGDVHLPELGASLPVVGYTAEDVSAVLASFSTEARNLEVEILPPRSRYWLYGEVGRGGRQALRPGTTVAEAVARAGPRVRRADLSRVRLLRGLDEPREVQVDLEAEPRHPDSRVLLQDGDVLLVPPRGAGNQTVGRASGPRVASGAP